MRYFIFIFWASLHNVICIFTYHTSSFGQVTFCTQQRMWLVATMLDSTALEELHVDRQRLYVSCSLLCPNRLPQCLEVSKYLMNKLIF